jgi:hypothetical protein
MAGFRRINVLGPPLRDLRFRQSILADATTIMKGIVMSNELIDMVAMLARWGADMDDGFAAFDVEGLVIVGQTFSGTPGSVVSVAGTLVCNPSQPTEAMLDTAEMPLDPLEARGRIDGVPAQCANAVFLIRIAALRGTNPDGAGESWTATGADHSIRHK